MTFLSASPFSTDLPLEKREEEGCVARGRWGHTVIKKRMRASREEPTIIVLLNDHVAGLPFKYLCGYP